MNAAGAPPPREDTPDESRGQEYHESDEHRHEWAERVPVRRNIFEAGENQRDHVTEFVGGASGPWGPNTIPAASTRFLRSDQSAARGVVRETEGMTAETTRPYRVTVRGQFDRAGDELRRRLLEEADAHDTVTAGRFTPEGTVTYQRDLVGFTFRYIIDAAGEDDAATDGELRAIEWLERAGWPYKRLSTVTAPVPQPRRR